MSTEDDILTLKSQYVGLLFDCPCNRTDVACPFRKIRERDVVARVNWLTSLSLEDFEIVSKQHQQCLDACDRTKT